MATKKGIDIKRPASWAIGLLFPDGKKIVKSRCTLNDLMDTYFLNLNRYLDKGLNSQKLLELYKKTYDSKGVKVAIRYIDSWGHKWEGKVAWPKENKFIEYLDSKLENN